MKKKYDREMTFHVKQEMYDRIKEICEKEDRFFSSLIRRFVKQGLDSYNSDTE